MKIVSIPGKIVERSSFNYAGPRQLSTGIDYRKVHLMRAYILAAILASASLVGSVRGQVKAPSDSQPQLFHSLTEAPTPGNAGIFVGINRFEDAGSLSFAVHDAIELGFLFVFELKLLPANECFLLLTGDATSDIAKQHLNELQRAGAKVRGGSRSEIVNTFIDVCGRDRSQHNLLICSFSTHGFEEGRDAYILPSDGRRADLPVTAVSLKFIEEKLEGTQSQKDRNTTAGHRLLLVDACQERVSSERSAATDGRPSSPVFIDAIKTPSGQAKLVSCSPGEMSAEFPALGGVGHGLFTWYFLEALRGAAKVDEQNVVRLDSVAEYVATQVKREREDRNRGVQRPFLVGPVLTKSLPLATRGDDMNSLIASVNRQPLGDIWTVELRDSLCRKLQRIDANDPRDRKLVVATREFVNSRLASDFFIPYLEREQNRWITSPATTDTKPVDPQVVSPPIAPDDDFTIPDGNDPKIIHEFLVSLSKTQPENGGLPGRRAHLRKVEGILKQVQEKELDEQTAVMASDFRFQLLQVLERFGDETAAADRQKFVETLTKSKNPKVADRGTMYSIAGRISGIGQMNADDRKKLVDDVAAYIRTGHISQERFEMADATGDLLATLGDYQLACTALDNFATAFESRQDEGLTEPIGMLRARARRYRLPGNVMSLRAKTIDGKQFDLSQFKNKVVLIKFSGTWCQPCVEEIPRLKELHKAYRAKGFEIVSINLDTSRTDLEAFLKKEAIPWPTLFEDPPSDSTADAFKHPIAVHYGILAIPTEILIGPDGKVVSLSATGDDLTKHLEKLLGPSGLKRRDTSKK